MNKSDNSVNKTSSFRLSDGVVVVFIGFLFSVFSLYLEVTSDNSLMAVLAGCLGLIILLATYVGYRRDGIFSPLVVFSAMYSGYVLGGFYYSRADKSFGKFLDFLGLEREHNVVLIQYGIVYAIICYLMFVFGYLAISRKGRSVFVERRSDFMAFFERNYIYCVVPLLSMGFIYWIWVAQVAAGGIVELVVKFQAFRHLISGMSITTLPYNFYYAGIFLWLLGAVGRVGKVGYLFWFFSFIGVLMIMTQGRITLAITFLLSQIAFIAIRDPLKEKVAIKAVGLIIFFAFATYFLRIASNYYFIGKDFSLSEFNLLEVIVGGGNVADLQQLAIIFYSFDIQSSLLGITYLDWMRNSLGGFLGLTPSSVGLIIKGLYVPESSGPPTPGAIGEAYANFNLVAPFFMFFVGLFLGYVRNLAINSGRLIGLLVYSVFLSRFVFIYPKVDSTMLVNFLWGVTPFLLVILVLYFFYSLMRSSNPRVIG